MKYSFEKIEDRKSYVWHTEGNNKTLIAITDDVEKAHFLATAANSYKEPSSLPEECEVRIQKGMIEAVYEGAEQWKQEYDMCRDILIELVNLKKLKDTQGKTEDYLKRQPLVWEAAKTFLLKYQHQ